MAIVWFIIFLFVSHFFALQIFRLTTYHKYFLPALPLLVAYSALVGWLLYKFQLHAFFLWQVAIVSVWLFVLARRNSRQAQAMLHAAGSDGDRVRFLAESIGKTKQFFAYSSFVYVLVFAAAFLWAYNT
ncbi:hypothetical protein [Arenimonas fontis]|uniref:Uncharacterized protein n=1 Tax=Arenimonas fontis TaxID=2608255 RepID=A0A5B2Z841_9GAMM|nr:hypothetical protein [Arenimonas fontis]KAA2284139.1 hypothetical protein F0415_11040 [Arenimonas fontis]